MTRKVTTTIRTEVTEQFNSAVSAAGLRRDSYLNDILPGELDELKELKPNSENGEKYLRGMRRFLHDDFSKVNITLDEEVATKLDKVCREKRIPRDIFIEEFMVFLSNGPENESCAAPLNKIIELRQNPRFEYIPNPDEKTPYDWLSLADKADYPDLEKAKELMRKALRKQLSS